MRVVLAIALVVAIAVAAAAAQSAVERTPRLAVVQGTPLALRGTGFRPSEAVRVSLLGTSRRSVRRAVANRSGSFKVGFPPLADACSVVIARAVGSLGSRATLQIGGGACPPPR